MELQEELWKIDDTILASTGKISIVPSSSKKYNKLKGPPYSKQEAFERARQLKRAYKVQQNIEQQYRKTDIKAVRKPVAKAVKKTKEIKSPNTEKINIGDFPFAGPNKDKNIFFEIAKYLDYIDIVNLCSSNASFMRFCEEKDIWLYLLERDFQPLLEEDRLLIESNPSATRDLYYKIQRDYIGRLDHLYISKREGNLIHLLETNPHPYYGVLWLINRHNIDPSYKWEILDGIGSMTALIVAIQYGHVDVVRFLLSWIGPNEKFIDPTDFDNYAILIACHHGQTEIVLLLLAWRGPNGEYVDPTALNNRSFIEIISSKEIKDTDVRITLAEILLDWEGPNGERVDPRDQDNLVILFACSACDKNMVKFLLSWHGPNGEWIDPRAQQNGAVIVASSISASIVKLLLIWRGPNGEFVDPRIQQNTPIIIACKYGKSDIVKLLLAWRGEKGQFVDPRMQQNEAVIRASMKGDFDIIKMLLGWRAPDGGRVNPSDQHNKAISSVGGPRRKEIVELLLTDKRVSKYALPLKSILAMTSSIIYKRK